MKHSKRLAMAALILLGAAVLAGAAVAGEVYTWTDEDGVIHFSDREPVGRDANVRDLPDTTPSSSPNPYEAPQAGKSAAQQRQVQGVHAQLIGPAISDRSALLQP